jgi:hypothetical protein
VKAALRAQFIARWGKQDAETILRDDVLAVFLGDTRFIDSRRDFKLTIPPGSRIEVPAQYAQNEYFKLAWIWHQNGKRQLPWMDVVELFQKNANVQLFDGVTLWEYYVDHANAGNPVVQDQVRLYECFFAARFAVAGLAGSAAGLAGKATASFATIQRPPVSRMITPSRAQLETLSNIDCVKSTRTIVVKDATIADELAKLPPVEVAAYRARMALWREYGYRGETFKAIAVGRARDGKLIFTASEDTAKMRAILDELATQHGGYAVYRKDVEMLAKLHSAKAPSGHALFSQADKYHDAEWQIMWLSRLWKFDIETMGASKPICRECESVLKAGRVQAATPTKPPVKPK